MVAAAERGAFQMIVVADQSRLGREAWATQSLIRRLGKAGVEVWSYLDGASLTPRNAMDKAMSSLRGFGDEAHREASSRKSHETHKAKHRRGQVVGGRVFGYRNVEVYARHDAQGRPLRNAHGRPLRSHVVREVDDVEAAVVLRIFELFA